MSGLRKEKVLKHDQRVVAAKKIDGVVTGHHAAIAEITGRIRHLAKDPLTVVVLGEFSSGKSSFLNRLFMTEVLPIAILPKTATLTRLVHGNEELAGRVEIHRQNDAGTETEAISHQAFAELQRAAKVHDIVVAQDLARIREVRVFLNDPLLTELELVDTPGFNHDQAMDERTLGILDVADIVLWITDAVQPAKQTEFEKLRLLKERGKRIWLIVNKADINVADGAAWEESRKSLEEYFRDIDFLDFFESRTVELISCRERDDFWCGKFEQTKARLGKEIFNMDLDWSSELVDDEWKRLREVLDDEAKRYAELERRCEALHALTRAKSLADRCQADLSEALEQDIRALQRALLQHGKDGRQAARYGIKSVTTFVMEYTRAPLVKAFRDLARTYDEFLAEWKIQHLTESIQLLEAIYGTLPAAHAPLRAETLALLDYERMLRDRLFRPIGRIGGYRLPALERTVEMLDHLGVQFESLDWRFSSSIEQDGVLPARVSGPELTLGGYPRLQLQMALETDFCSDLERIVREPVCLDLLAHLKSLCHGTVERLTAALNIWSDHATGSEAD